MAYSELIKGFKRIQAYLRDFYVYGFKVRGEFIEKSSRSYDNERCRVESWMGDYVSFTQDSRGKRVFLSMDSRSIPHNPLYRAFKAKSFTQKDILLHFTCWICFRIRKFWICGISYPCWKKPIRMRLEAWCWMKKTFV